MPRRARRQYAVLATRYNPSRSRVMALVPGTRLGPYEIDSALGRGMGEVYRARDPERAARFHREAHLLAALNHPHIATIHGFEEAAPSVG